MGCIVCGRHIEENGFCYRLKDMVVSLCEEHILDYVPLKAEPITKPSQAARLVRNN